MKNHIVAVSIAINSNPDLQLAFKNFTVEVHPRADDKVYLPYWLLEHLQYAYDFTACKMIKCRKTDMQSEYVKDAKHCKSINELLTEFMKVDYLRRDDWEELLYYRTRH